MNCPRDKAGLEPLKTTVWAGFRCPSCGGMWIDLDAEDALPLTLEGVNPEGRTPLPVSEDLQAKSPHDGQPMLLIKYRGVQIDYCRGSKAVWFDHGELEKILAREPSPSKKDAGKSKDSILDAVDVPLVDLPLGEALDGLFNGVVETFFDAF